MSKNHVAIREWAFFSLANLMSNLVCSKSLFDCTKKEGRELKETMRELAKILGISNDAFYEKLINEKLEERKIRIQKSIKKDNPDLLYVLPEWRSDRDDELKSLPRNIIRGILFVSRSSKW
ncbi:hypothetical protein PS1_026090 [Malus domestica]